MYFRGRHRIPASPQVVWSALNDPNTLKACIPGCDTLQRSDATHLAATGTLRIGPIKARFKAIIEQSELDPPHRCVLKGEGQGGIAGFARGEAEVLLVPENDGTLLSYVAKASFGGKLAQIGQRLIDGAAKRLADDFFLRVASLVKSIAPPDTIAAEQPVPQVPPMPPAPSETNTLADLPGDSRRDGLPPKVWVVGLLVIIVVLLVVFGLLSARP